MFEMLKIIVARISESKIPESRTIELKSDKFSLSDDKGNWPLFQSLLSSVLEEYKTLRSESLQISSLMINIFQMGTAALGLLFGSTIIAWGNKDIKEAAFYMLYLVIPCFVYFIAISWI